MVLVSRAWLSLTPEPERVLPDAVATLRAGGHPSAEQVAAERARAERLVRRANRRGWRRWLSEARTLARSSRTGGDPQVAEAAELAVAVIDNHDALALGITSRGRGANNE
jgi:hypothetical protein